MVLHPAGDQSPVVSIRGQCWDPPVQYFIDNMDEGMESFISKFTDDTKLGACVNLLGGRSTLQRALEWLDEWEESSKMRFNKSKY